MQQAPGLGLLTTDSDLIVRSWNAWLADATRIAEEQAVGRLLLELISEERRELYRDVLSEVLARGSARVLAPAFHQYLFSCAPATPSDHFDRMQQRVTVAALRVDTAIAGVIITIEDMTPALDAERTLAATLHAGDQAAVDARSAIGADDWRVRRAAVRTLQQSVTADDIAHLLHSIEHEHQDLAVLNSALRVLIAAKRDVVKPLLVLLGDPHPNVRMHAALALGELGDDAAVEGLIAALADDDANVRFHAIEALGRLGAPAAVEPLTRIAESGDFFLAFPAVDALARTDDPRVAPNLMALLHQDLLRPAVIDTLAAIGDEECVAPLVALLDAGEAPVGAVAAALVRLRNRYEDTFAAGEQIADITRQTLSPAGVRRLTAAVERRETPLRAIVTVLGWIGAPAADALVAMLDEQDVQADAAAALVAIGKAAVPALSAALTSDDRTGRLAAAELLGQLGDRRAVPALGQLLRSADDNLTTAAAAALASLGDSTVLDDLLALFPHEHTGVRRAAIAAVNAIGAPATEARLRELLTSSDMRVREAAIRVAGYFGFASTSPAILDALSDPEEEVRRAAIEQLPILEHPQATARLANALATETPRNRAAAAHAARSVTGAAMDDALITALHDADPWVRYFAASSLAERGDRAATPLLGTIAVDDPAPHVRIAALQALGTLEPEAVLPLAERLIIAGDDDDAACAALMAVASVADERVDALLPRAASGASLALRRCAIAALARRPGRAAIDTLTFAAQMNDPPDISTVAIDALVTVAAESEQATRDEAIGAVLSLGQDVDRRSEVVAAVARLGGNAVPPVAAALRNAPTAIRLTAVDVLARMRQPESSRVLAEALSDSDALVRGAAVAAFGRLGTPAVGHMIARLRHGDPDEVVRRRAALVCERYGWGT